MEMSKIRKSSHGKYFSTVGRRGGDLYPTDSAAIGVPVRDSRKQAVSVRETRSDPAGGDPSRTCEPEKRPLSRADVVVFRGVKIRRGRRPGTKPMAS